MDYSIIADDKLCNLTLNGDTLAEEELYKRHSLNVKRWCRPYFLIGADYEDIIQEGMIALLSAIRSFDCSTGVSFKSFAEICVKRKIISTIRLYNRKKEIPLNQIISLESLTDDYSIVNVLERQTEDFVIAEENIREIQEAITDSLSKYENDVLALFLQGLSYRDIAEMLSKSEKSVDNAVQRIRKKVLQHIS